MVLVSSSLILHSQIRIDTNHYLPQISIGAANGFGPYILGTSLENFFFAYDLPDKTSRVTFRFLDSDSVQVGHSSTDEAPDLEFAIWFLNLDTLNLPLSPMIHVEVIYKADSVANYYIAYAVYPDSVTFAATQGFGPCITNNYVISDINHWQPVPEMTNTFTVKNLPPRSDTVAFYIMSVDTTIIDSLVVTAHKGEYLDSASFPNVRMDNLPLSTRFLMTRINCNGAPKGGLCYYKPLEIVPQRPYMLFRSEGLMLTDSLAVAVENQITGHVLSIDSIKYAEVINGPGTYAGEIQSPPYASRFQGPYSFDLINDNFSIEVWIQLDTGKLIQGTPGEMKFLRVDSVWSLSVRNNPSAGTVQFVISSLFECDTTIYYGEVHYPLIMTSDWHHIAFVVHGDPKPNACTFYLDGVQRNSYISSTIQYFYDHTLYQDLLQTKSLYIGGGHPDPRQNRSDPSFVTAIDEIRIWDKELITSDIRDNYIKIILQDEALTGYWNFNNVNERKGIIQDISHRNNPGVLYNGAVQIPQYPRSQETIDSIRIYSSNASTDSVRYTFLGDCNSVLDSVTLPTVNHHATLVYDVSALPYTADYLRITEFFPGKQDVGFITTYPIQILAPPPLVSSMQGWNYYYHSSDSGLQHISDTGQIFNTLMVSGLPERTRKVTLGLMKDGMYHDTLSYGENCVPYHHSLALNGEDNYIDSHTFAYGPSETFTLMLWFNTTTTEGGEMLRFGSTRPGLHQTDLGPYIRMKTDGAVEFGLPTEGGEDTVLHASNKFNDGAWHFVVATYDGHFTNRAALYIDGCLVDENKDVENVALVYGKLFIGKTFEKIITSRGERDIIADYFKGSLSEISTWHWVLDFRQINRQMFQTISNLQPGCDVVNYLKLNEDTGTIVHNYGPGQANCTLHGGSRKWVKSKGLSKIAWNRGMVDKEPGEYVFFAKVYYDGGPDTGVCYPLGKFFIKDPVPGFYFTYRLSAGQGYFDEGTRVDNRFEFWTNYDRSDQFPWTDNGIVVQYIDEENYVFDEKILYYDEDSLHFADTVDMGDITPGSYLRLLFGYEGYTWIWEHDMTIPVLTRPMIPPKMLGDFGPFDQAIAPGTMVHMNTFRIITEVYDDLKKIITRFYKHTGEEIDTIHPVKVNDTTWVFSYDMASLSPPTTLMKIEYYLGDIPKPALIQGPFAITIHKTRPAWFDFIPDNAFHNISEPTGEVKFSISTTVEEGNDIFNSALVTAPNYIPLVGGCSSNLSTPTVNVGLIYDVAAYKLSINGDMTTDPEILDFGVGQARMLKLKFHSSLNNEYKLDDNNNLIAMQNFTAGGSFSTKFKSLENIVEKVEQLIDIAEATNPESLIISSSFSFTLTGGFQYSSRLNLQVDPVTGKWGSVGNLKVNATDNESEEYKKSASFHFYSGDIGAEFSIGAKFLTGLVEGEFSTVLRFDLGFGHSWKSLPSFEQRPLKSFAFDVYGKGVIKIFWGWYSKTVWGPRMFYSTTLWGDHLKDIFPEIEKKNLHDLSIPANSSWPELVREIRPVSMFTKLPLSYPQGTIISSGKGSLFTWLQRGQMTGERTLKASFFDKEQGKFTDQVTIAVNNNAINTPDAAIMNDSILLFSWAQSRHTQQTVHEVRTEDILKEFVMSQDICYAVYDMNADSVILSGLMEDDNATFISGRAEANPEVLRLAENRAMVTWQVADLDANNSDIWYSVLEKQGQSWIALPPAIAAEIEGFETNLEIESPAENQAVMVWMNTPTDDKKDNRLMTTLFNGETWSVPTLIYNKEEGFFHNDLDMDFTDGIGAAVWTTFVKDSLHNTHEMITVLPWDPIGNRWSMEAPVKIYSDSNNHVQHPEIKINSDGRVVIAMKVEEITTKTLTKAISQVDLLIGDMNSLGSPWRHVPADCYICDTSMQVADLDFSFAGEDTLMTLTHEFIMLPTNAPFTPRNGIVFGDPYMNLVLRCFAIDASGMVTDVNEEDYFVDVPEYKPDLSGIQLYQNYPNPCQDYTFLRFHIPENIRVTLGLFNINGMAVGVLADQEMLPGTYEMMINTSLLPSGTYFCHLTAGHQVRTIKMMVGN
jgi:hypothetical protein